MLLATFLLYLVVVRLDPGTGLRFPIFQIPLWLWRRSELLVINLVCVNVSGRYKIWVTRNLVCLMFPVAVHAERWSSNKCQFSENFPADKVQTVRGRQSCPRLSLFLIEERKRTKFLLTLVGDSYFLICLVYVSFTKLALPFCSALQLLPHHCHSFTSWSSSSDRLGQLSFLQSIGLQFGTKCLHPLKVSPCLGDLTRLFRDCWNLRWPPMDSWNFFRQGVVVYEFWSHSKYSWHFTWSCPALG